MYHIFLVFTQVSYICIDCINMTKKIEPYRIFIGKNGVLSGYVLWNHYKLQTGCYYIFRGLSLIVITLVPSPLCIYLSKQLDIKNHILCHHEKLCVQILFILKHSKDNICIENIEKENWPISVFNFLQKGLYQI